MNTLLTESILSTYCFPHAAIYRRKDCSVKVRTMNWPMSSSDTDKLNDLFEEAVETREQGFVLGGVPYRSIRVDDRSIYGKRDEDALALLELQQQPPPQPQQMQLALPSSLSPSSRGSSTSIMPGSSTSSPTSTSMGPSPGPGSTTHPPEKIDKSVVEVQRPTSATSTPRAYHGIIICRTHQYFVLGIYDAHPGMAVEAMERLADYFRSKGR
ncbi:hypothetical protein HMI54_006485 [Coelomomyces lativittatus]|nr:hypothetical protein HMI55_007379 [Coelomomyces lativittatus]KAJ1514133.1 hypothetical protein HMI56_001096 [Coelomomyces lativittatus]KAJ1517228.1 hypothetical protein HMI54_006485 [Coelomomyces lativittatus]